jgi:hypothetical protein
MGFCASLCLLLQVQQAPTLTCSWCWPPSGCC